MNSYRYYEKITGVPSPQAAPLCLKQKKIEELDHIRNQHT